MLHWKKALRNLDVMMQMDAFEEYAWLVIFYN